MGLIGARRARDILRNTRLITAFELICACQAADIRGSDLLSFTTLKVLQLVREKNPCLYRDLPLTDPLEDVGDLIQSGTIREMLDKDSPAMEW